ncbi:hypothetical protein AcV7_001162 [Taiwanofungus camphoratus]|nr:hypothetical protein AcV7_001162 [Antrodia cinnamomea]
MCRLSSLTSSFGPSYTALVEASSCSNGVNTSSSRTLNGQFHVLSVLTRYRMTFVWNCRQVYGGIGLLVAVIALIGILALSNRSYMWTRVCKILWPFVIIICAVRAIIMIVELQRGKSEIEWECANGHALWPPSAAQGYGGTKSMPGAICTAGFQGTFAVFIVALLIDLAFQMYMFFMTWRYQKLLEHYQSMKPSFGGYYNA